MISFGDLFNLYYERHVKIRNRCPENARYFFSAHGDYWKSRKIEEITRFEVQDWFDDLATRSKSSALRAVNIMSACINWGIRRGYVTCINPCQGVEKFKLQSRERFLMPCEITRFREALDQEPDYLRDFFWLCLFTGARRGNVQSMHWHEIDTDLAIWRIPPGKHKNGESHNIPLSTFALAVLQRRLNVKTCSDYVFPGRTGGHLVEPKRAWKRVLKRAGIDDLRIHDLRRTLGSYLAIKGASPYLIGKALGHRDPRSTAVYAKMDLEPVRQAIESIQNTFF